VTVGGFIVDDESGPDARGVRYADLEGYAHPWVSAPPQGAAALHAGEFAAVTDLMMPEMDGYRLDQRRQTSRCRPRPPSS